MKTALVTAFYLLKNLYLKLFCKNIYISFKSRVAYGTKLSKYTKIGKNSYLNGSIESYSYIGENCKIYAKIGKYSSISNNVKVIHATHPINYISTSPVFYSNEKQCGFSFVLNKMFDDLLYLDKTENIVCEIGNDVWIGEGVTIIGGVKIGDGSIIGMNALVTKNVDSYSVVAGVPARKIRMRFSEREIELLQKYTWWKKSDKWIKEHAYLFINRRQFFSYFENCEENSKTESLEVN